MQKRFRGPPFKLIQHFLDCFFIFREIPTDFRKLKASKDAGIALSLEKKFEGSLHQHLRGYLFIRQLLII